MDRSDKLITNLSFNTYIILAVVYIVYLYNNILYFDNLSKLVYFHLTSNPVAIPNTDLSVLSTPVLNTDLSSCYELVNMYLFSWNICFKICFIIETAIFLQLNLSRRLKISYDHNNQVVF
jgi:hypothetical protein